MFNVGDKVKFSKGANLMTMLAGGSKTKEAAKGIGEVIEYGGKFFQSNPDLPKFLKFKDGGAVQTYKIRWENGFEKEYPEFLLIKADSR